MSLLYIILGIGFLVLQFYSSVKQHQREESSMSRPAGMPLGDASENTEVGDNDWYSDISGEGNCMESDASERTGFQNEYFTYENADVHEAVRPTMNQGSSMDNVQEKGWSKTLIEKSFDLRQAVIYQAILNRVDN